MSQSQILLGICSREETKTHAEKDYTHVISLIDPEKGPTGIHVPNNVQLHKLIAFHDIDDIEAKAPKYVGCIKPTTKHVKTIMVAFESLRSATQPTGVLIHCEAGISRSTAGAIIGLCALGIDPENAFHQITYMNELGLPNRRMLRIAGELLDDNQTLVKLSHSHRKVLFEKYQQIDPIEILQLDLQSQNQLLLSLKRLIAWSKEMGRDKYSGSLEKTMERWRTKIQMAQRAKANNALGPQKESLRNLIPTG